jgi:hypothetical protein
MLGIIYLVTQIYSHMCGIDFLKKPNRVLVDQLDTDLRTLQEEEWRPLRIHLDYSRIEHLNSTDVTDLKEKIMPKTKQVFESILKVKQMKNKLRLNSTCDESDVPEIYKEEGVDADIVIFVKIDESGFFLQNKIEAAAIHCLQDSITRRPIAGFITFKPELGIANSTAVDYMVWLALHEITHVLVFNDSLYPDFIDKDMKPLGADKVVSKKILPNGKKMSLIKSPKIVEKGKAHFGCAEFEGVPLEYNGGMGTAGAHWSKKYMNTDYMIGDSYGENLISEISLALFEDSGWYSVDYTMANLFLWGKDKGCSFLDPKSKCLKAEKNTTTSSFTPEFCTQPNYPVCSVSNTFRGTCKVRKYQNELFEHERYFGDSRIGGIDQLTDKCPIATENKNKQMYYGGSCRVGSETNTKSFEKVCPECACFMSNLRPKKPKLRFKQIKGAEAARGLFVASEIDNPNLKEDEFIASCISFSCKDGNLFIQIGENGTECASEGLTNIEGYDGGIQCPSVDILCHDKFKCKFGCVEKYDNNIKSENFTE